nr:MAG TPA: hypothetical protein [Caudoviricetes sp.]
MHKPLHSETFPCSLYFAHPFALHTIYGNIC